MSIDVLGEDSGENVQNSDYDRVIVSDREEHVAQRLTLDDYRRILRELDQNRDLQNRRREKLSQVSQRRLRKKRTSDAGNQETSTRSSSCYLCNIRVALEDITTFAICRGCDQTVCRARRCSDWDRSSGYWECVSCIRSRDSQVRAGEWILDQLNQRFKNPRSDTSRDDLSFKDAETQSNGSFLGSTHSISLEQKDKVREFLEDVIASMIGGSLDDVPVNQTHKHPSYLPLPENECPGVAHANLKRLIQKVIEEALNLPDLFNYSGHPQRPDSYFPYFSSKRYEQLLATAVLNKVVDHYRNPKNHQENSSGIQSGSEFDSNHNALSDKAALLSPTGSQKALDKHLEEASQMSESSLKTRSTESDETYLSDYIQKHRVPLPDLSAASSEGTVDDTASEMTAGTEGTWEENWLFKKRKVKSDTNSTAIGMLVPSPTEEVKAFIGDKNVDEVSDLSEAGSDVDDDTEDRPAAKLIESKTIIGGKNELISLEDTSSATDSLLSNPDSGINVTEARNEVLLIDGEFIDGPHATDPPQAINENVQTFLNGTDSHPIPIPRQSTTEKAEKLQLLDENLAEQSVEVSAECSVTLKPTDLFRENFLSHLKPQNIHESNQPISPNFSEDWVLIQGSWEVSDPSESILINSGKYEKSPVELTAEELCMSMNHQVQSREKLYQYKFLNDLKPDKLPEIIPEMPEMKVTEDLSERSLSCHEVLPHEEKFENKFLNDLKPDKLPENVSDTSENKDAEELAANSPKHEVLPHEKIFEYTFLNDLKPEGPPAREALHVQTTSQNKEDNTLPTPEVELSSTDEFVCVMTYDEKRQLIVCGSPKAKKKTLPGEDDVESETQEAFEVSQTESWEPQVCERVEEDTKETPPAVEGDERNDSVFVEGISDNQKPPVALPRRRSSRKSQGEEKGEKPSENSQNIHNEETTHIPKYEIQSKTEESSCELKTIEECSQVEKCESKCTEIHVTSQEKISEVIQTETTTVEIQKGSAEIHLRSEESVEVLKELTEKSSSVTTEIQTMNEVFEEKETNLHLKTVEQESVTEVVQDIQLGTAIEEYVENVPEIEDEAKSDEVMLSNNETGDKPEIHLRTAETLIEIHPRTVDSSIDKECEDQSGNTIEVSDNAKEDQTKDTPVFHLRTGLGTFSIKTSSKSDTKSLADEQKSELETEMKTVPKIHLRIADNEPEATPEIHVRTANKDPKAINLAEQILSDTQRVSDEDLNAKIDEILQEELKNEEVKVKEEFEKINEEFPDVSLQEPATEANIMSTSTEIKEQLKKIVKPEEEPIERPKTLAIENEDTGEEEEVHLRYKSPIFQKILPRGTPAVVKLSDISSEDIGRLIDVANIIKRSSLQSPEEPAKGDGSTLHDFDHTNTLTNQETPIKVTTNAESLEIVSKVPEIQSDTPEPDSLEDEHLIPGSIAEREHLKWQHPDADIPNNPYSPEALQQRLVGKGYNGQNSTTSTPSNVESPQKTPERSLQVVLGEGSPDFKRYGRDYYINDAKRSSGTRKKHPDDPSRTSDEDKSGLFVATPIRVDEAEIAGDSLTRTSIDSSETSNTSLQLTDSLTPSEDSDTTRIYEIETRETRLLRQSVISSSRKAVGSTRTPPSTPTEDTSQPPNFSISIQAIERETKALREIEDEVNKQESQKMNEVRKTVSPDTVKFFAPKKPPVFSPTSPTKTPLDEPASEMKTEINNNNEVANKMVIEEEVVPTLPSVKKLMSAFSNTSNEPEQSQKPKVRPKSLPLQVDQMETTKVPEGGKKSSPSNGKSPMIPGYSITARSLSKQFRAELKHSTSQEDETQPDTRNAVKEGEKGKRHSSPERPPSPVLLPGRLKNNIAFFENLRNK